MLKRYLLLFLIGWLITFFDQSIITAQKPVVQKVDTVDFAQLNKKYRSPHKATFYAVIFPGGGQIYNRKYWKLPILYAGMGALIYGISWNTQYYNKYKNAYHDFVINDPANTRYTEFIPSTLTYEDVVYGDKHDWFESALQNKYKFYRKQRDMCYMGLIAVYAASIVDATVDAHLMTFDISEELSLNVQPTFINGTSMFSGTPGLHLSLNF